MADKKQLAIIGKGVDAWNEWRKVNPYLYLDLTDFEFAGMDLHGIDLSRISLNGENLQNANLSYANLHQSSAISANFAGAKLVGADLEESCLVSANFRGSDLYRATLNHANLARADLTNANLCGAELIGTNLKTVEIDGANLESSYFNWTSIVDVDLSQVRGLGRVLHDGPSSIGLDTICRSHGNIPEVFLRGCGVPEPFITYARSLISKPFEFYSCFISHSAKDKRFCERLYADLQAKGVRTWYFPQDARWGESVWGEIDRGVKIYDKLIVVCSEDSLHSSPVQREIGRALIREDKDHKNILFPIRIDDYVFDSWENERKADVLRKVVGDFTGWDRDAAKYEKAFEKLLNGLQADISR